MFTRFDLSYRRQPDGRYIYYPFAIWIGRGYIITPETKLKIIGIRYKQVVLFTSTLSVGIGVFFLDKIFGLIVCLTGVALSQLWITVKLQRILSGYKLVKVEPINYFEYLRKLAASVREKELKSIIRSTTIVLLVGLATTAYGYNHDQIKYLILGGAILLLSMLTALFCVYVIMLRKK